MLKELELPWLLAPDLPSNKQVNLTWCSTTLCHKNSLPGGLHLTKGQLYLKVWPNVNLTWSSITLGHKMSLLGVHWTKGQADQNSKTPGHKMSLPGGGSGWHFVRQAVSQPASQPACQPASCNWPANQPGEKMSTCQTSGWSDSWWWKDWGPNHIGPQSMVPALLLIPFGGVTYLTKTRQVTEMSSAVFYIPLALLLGNGCSFVSM